MKNKKAFSLLELSIVILIIGILIGGVIQGAKLYYQMKLTSARSITESSDVNSIKDLILWVDATQSGSLRNTSNTDQKIDGDAINYWRDRNPQFSTPLIFSQSTAGNYPLYEENAINGLPSLYFDGAAGGAGDWLETADEPRITHPNSHSIFVVVMPLTGYSTTQANIGVLSKEKGTAYDGTSITNSPYALAFQGTNNAFSYGATDSSNSRISGSGSVTNTVVNDQAAIGTVIWDSVNTTNGFKMYTNGSQKALATSGTSVASVPSSLYIGRYFTGSGFYDRYFKGYIGEIIMYDRALTTEERKAVEKYLGKKWGVKLSY